MHGCATSRNDRYVSPREFSIVSPRAHDSFRGWIGRSTRSTWCTRGVPRFSILNSERPRNWKRSSHSLGRGSLRDQHRQHRSATRSYPPSTRRIFSCNDEKRRIINTGVRNCPISILARWIDPRSGAMNRKGFIEVRIIAKREIRNLPWFNLNAQIWNAPVKTYRYKSRQTLRRINICTRATHFLGLYPSYRIESEFLTCHSALHVPIEILSRDSLQRTKNSPPISSNATFPADSNGIQLLRNAINFLLTNCPIPVRKNYRKLS